MKNLLLFIISILIGGIVAVGYYRFIVDKKSILSPISQNKESAFSIANPPKQSITGKIISMTGMVEWESRVATQPAQIVKPVPIQQGENLITKDDGNVSVTFDNIGNIKLLPKTEVDFVQTLPLNFVVNQKSGTAVYTKTGTVPFSIRSLHLLVTITGEIKLAIDEEEPTITINVNEGKATIAYNDLQNISHVLTIDQGESFVFDDQNRR